ncbi:MAG: hypothetical protein RIE24_07745 [Silicimonas sp.]
MMRRATLAGVFASLALAGCMETAEFGGSGGSFGGSNGGFGGSGGSNFANLSLGRDACTRTLREQGWILVRVDSVREYGGSTPRGVEVRMTARRDALSVNTEPRVCRFSYASGTADISRT